MELERMTRIAGRSAAALTRRDVALALLTEPAGAALAGLPGLRRDLFARIVEFEATEGQDLTAEYDEGWDDCDRDEVAAAQVVGLGLFPVLRLWRQLGALDHDDRLTELGWWGIPESLRRARQPALPGEQDSPAP